MTLSQIEKVCHTKGESRLWNNTRA